MKVVRRIQEEEQKKDEETRKETSLEFKEMRADLSAAVATVLASIRSQQQPALLQ